MSRNILIFRTGQLGDTLIAMPAISAIRQKYPHHKLALLTDKHDTKNDFVSSWEVLKPAGWFDEALFYTPTSGLRNKAEVFSSLIQQLRDYNFDHIYDLSPERTAFQHRRDSFFFRKIIGTSHYHSSGTFHFPDKKEDGTYPRVKPEWQRLLEIVKVAVKNEFHLTIPEDARQEAARLLKEMNLNSHRLIALGPGSKMPAKQWPVERYRQLGSKLLDAYPDAMLVTLGGNSDEAICSELCRSWGSRSCNLSGRLSVHGSAAVLELCKIYVGNDTGTMHLAAMAGIPCVALFSARDLPGMWEPYGNGHKILRHEVECTRCMLTVCNRNNKCLNKITVEETLSGVLLILEQ